MTPKLVPKQRFSPLDPPIYDPMHFLMIQSIYWSHPFHRKVLDLTLWISLDCYIKWITQVKLRNSSESERSEYVKKVNLTLFVFLLSIEEPTRMIQYQPVEADSLRDIFIQPAFPALILESPVINYLFSSSLTKGKEKIAML